MATLNNADRLLLVSARKLRRECALDDPDLRRLVGLASACESIERQSIRDHRRGSQVTAYPVPNPTKIHDVSKDPFSLSGQEASISIDSKPQYTHPARPDVNVTVVSVEVGGDDDD